MPSLVARPREPSRPRLVLARPAALLLAVGLAALMVAAPAAAAARKDRAPKPASAGTTTKASKATTTRSTKRKPGAKSAKAEAGSGSKVEGVASVGKPAKRKRLRKNRRALAATLPHSRRKLAAATTRPKARNKRRRMRLAARVSRASALALARPPITPATTPRRHGLVDPLPAAGLPDLFGALDTVLAPLTQPEPEFRPAAVTTSLTLPLLALPPVPGSGRGSRGAVSIAFEEQAPDWCVPPRLREVLADVSRRFGPVRVYSSFRTLWRNRLVGGRTFSYHLTCQAVDFMVPGPKRKVLAFLRSHPLVGGYKLYPLGFFHIDVGPRRTW